MFQAKTALPSHLPQFEYFHIMTGNRRQELKTVARDRMKDLESPLELHKEDCALENYGTRLRPAIFFAWIGFSSDSRSQRARRFCSPE